MSGRFIQSARAAVVVRWRLAIETRDASGRAGCRRRGEGVFGGGGWGLGGGLRGGWRGGWGGGFGHVWSLRPIQVVTTLARQNVVGRAWVGGASCCGGGGKKIWICFGAANGAAV